MKFDTLLENRFLSIRDFSNTISAKYVFENPPPSPLRLQNCDKKERISEP